MTKLEASTRPSITSLITGAAPKINPTLISFGLKGAEIFSVKGVLDFALLILRYLLYFVAMIDP